MPRYIIRDVHNIINIRRIEFRLTIMQFVRIRTPRDTRYLIMHFK